MGLLFPQQHVVPVFLSMHTNFIDHRCTVHTLKPLSVLSQCFSLGCVIKGSIRMTVVTGLNIWALSENYNGLLTGRVIRWTLMAIHGQTVPKKKSSQQVVEVFVSAFILCTDQLCVCVRERMFLCKHNSNMCLVFSPVCINMSFKDWIPAIILVSNPSRFISVVKSN